MAKKVSFGNKEKPAEAVPVSADRWVDTGSAAEPEKLTRFTIDLPGELHQRIKVYCSMNGITMKERLIELFEENFPPLPPGYKK